MLFLCCSFLQTLNIHSEVVVACCFECKLDEIKWIQLEAQEWKITIEYWREYILMTFKLCKATLSYKLQSFNSKVSKIVQKLRYFPCLITTLNPICSRLFFINIIFFISWSTERERHLWRWWWVIHIYMNKVFCFGHCMSYKQQKQPNVMLLLT